MNNNLTDRQKEILSFISEHLEEFGYPPTYREIASHFNLASTFGVKRHLDALIKKGFISVESNSSRAITINSSEGLSENNGSKRSIEVPLLGRVAAGFPLLSDENIEGKLSLDASFFKAKNDCFGLKVSGDSMLNAGIFPGDIVIVNPQKNASSGEIVVAMIEGETTLKRFLVNTEGVFLKPENEKYPLIDVKNKEDFSIIGKIIGVFRYFN